MGVEQRVFHMGSSSKSDVILLMWTKRLFQSGNSGVVFLCSYTIFLVLSLVVLQFFLSNGEFIEFIMGRKILVNDHPEVKLVDQQKEGHEMIDEPCPL